MNFLLDTKALGALCHPRREMHAAIGRWLAGVLEGPSSETRVFVPEIADYELRRKLLHLIGKRQASVVSLERLDALAAQLDYLPLSTPVMRHAAELWSRARLMGTPTAPNEHLDGDVILAAQALAVDGTVITDNVGHLGLFVPVKRLDEIQSEGRRVD